jgi:hypothetical protein
MSGYDNPLTISYNFGSHDFGAGAGAHAVQRPYGTTMCRIEEIHVGPITETFTADTTAAFVRVGTASDPDKFAELAMATAAATDGYGTNDDNDAIKAAGKFIDLNRDGDSGASLDQLEVTFVAPTGGTPAGIGVPTVVLAWY